MRERERERENLVKMRCGKMDVVKKWKEILCQREKNRKTIFEEEFKIVDC